MIDADLIEKMRKTPERLIKPIFAWARFELSAHPPEEREELRKLIDEAEKRNAKAPRASAGNRRRARKATAASAVGDLPLGDQKRST